VSLAVAAKILLLLLLLLASAGAAFTYSSWRKVERDLKKTNLLAFRILTLPSAMMFAYYFFGWQAAVVLGYAQNYAIGRLRPEPTKPRLRALSLAAKAVIAAMLLWCVLTGDNALLRYVLWAAMAAAAPVAFDDLWTNAKLEKSKCVLNYWPRLVFPVLALMMIVLGLGEVLWRYTGFEWWMWYYSFFALVTFALMMAAVMLAAPWLAPMDEKWRREHEAGQ
jgi:Mn2+/Fe2+ NRAMP family transporter